MSAQRHPVRPDDRPVGPHYADVFAAPLRPGDPRTGLELLRDGLDGMPRPLRAVVLLAQERVLGLRLARPRSGPEHVLGWRIALAEPEEVRLEAASPVVDATLIGRREAGDVVSLTTVLRYLRPRRARLLWAVVGPVHRRVGPYLLDRAVAGGRR